MADPTTSDHEAELARRDEEILRLRDLLIAKDRELGAVKGRLAELEHYTGRLITLAARAQAIGPGSVRLLATRLRRPGGRQGSDGG